VAASAIVVQQVTSVCLFGVVYVHMQRRPDNDAIAMALVALSAVSFAAHALIATQHQPVGQ